MDNQPQVPQQPLTKREKREQRRAQREAERLTRTRSKRGGLIAFWLVIIVVIGGTITGIISLAKNNPRLTGPTGEMPIVTEVDHSKGSIDAKVTLVEYSDFQCPACGAYYPLMKKMTQEFSDRVRFIYRNFPLRTLHPSAQIAAQAAEAANLQDKFWEMHDVLFENQSAWSALPDPRTAFTEYAKKLNLDVKKFQSDMNSSLTRDRVNLDSQGGERAGVNATPTLFLNGKAITNPAGYEPFEALLESALAQ